MLIFDIETGALPDDDLRKFLPEFTPPPHPGEFDPSSVKYGNLKDEAKRAAKLEDCRAAHVAEVAGYDQAVAAAKEQHWQDFKANAALNPVTGQVLAIGLYSVTRQSFSLSAGPEADILANFWQVYAAMRQAGRRMVGCNCLEFDLPFLVRRSWILGVDVPATAHDGHRYFDRLFTDIREVWLLGQRWTDCPSSLSTIARALNCGNKPEGMNGQHFAALWAGGEEERKQAIEYLRNDVDMTAKCAAKLGLV